MTYAEKLAAAKSYLGNRWVLHPEYRLQDNPKHQFWIGTKREYARTDRAVRT